MAEDVEFTSLVAEAEGTTFRGHEGVLEWWETVRGAFQEVRWELLEVRGAGDCGVTHFRLHGTLGSVPVEQTMWQAARLRDGKVRWWAFFRTERRPSKPWGCRSSRPVTRPPRGRSRAAERMEPGLEAVLGDAHGAAAGGGELDGRDLPLAISRRTLTSESWSLSATWARSCTARSWPSWSQGRATALLRPGALQSRCSFHPYPSGSQRPPAVRFSFGKRYPALP